MLCVVTNDHRILNAENMEEFRIEELIRPEGPDHIITHVVVVVIPIGRTAQLHKDTFEGCVAIINRLAQKLQAIEWRS